MGRLASHPYKLPAAAGVLLAFGYFPLGLVVPNLVALIPLLVWIDANLEKPWRAWRNAGFVFGMALNLLILSWMRSMLAISFLGIFAYLGLAVVFAVGLSLAVIALAWTRKRTRWAYVVLLPAVWLTLEWVQAQGDLRMTAQHLGQTLGAVPFLVQFGMYLSPVFFSSALVPERFRFWYGLNPMVGVIDGFRWSLFGGKFELDPASFSLSVVLVVVVLVSGIWFYRRTERAFADLV